MLSGLATTNIVWSIARRPQDAQTNIPLMMPTQLWDRDEDTARGHEWRKSDGPNKELSKRSGPLDESE